MHYFITLRVDSVSKENTKVLEDEIRMIVDEAEARFINIGWQTYSLLLSLIHKAPPNSTTHAHILHPKDCSAIDGWLLRNDG